MEKISPWLLAIILPVATLQAFSSSFIYDFPQVFEAILIQRMGINAYKVQILYSIGTLPNLCSNLIGSLFIPKLGVGYIVLIYQTFAFNGAALTYLAVRMNNYNFLCFGRLFVGISFDLCCLSSLLCCEKWFRGKFLSISVGLSEIIRLLGSSTCYYFLPKLFLSSRNMEASAFCAVVVCFIIFSTTTIFAILDIKYEHLLKIDEVGEKNEDLDLQKTLNQQTESENFNIY